MRKRPRKCSIRKRAAGASGFSLLEVVIAVGIFAVAVTAMLALLPALNRQAVVAEETLVAARLPDILRLELRRLIDTNGFDALAGEAAVLTNALPATLHFAATRDGGRLHTLVYQPPPEAERIGEEQRYFLVEAWRFGTGPLVFDASGATLALHVRVSWPYRLPGSLATTPATERESLAFNLAINR